MSKYQRIFYERTSVTFNTGYRLKIENGTDKRKVLLEIGNKYVVEPLNPKKEKHKGRRCTIVKFVYDQKDLDDGWYEQNNKAPFHLPESVSVKFHDNNRTGKVDLVDLVPFVE